MKYSPQFGAIFFGVFLSVVSGEIFVCVFGFDSFAFTMCLFASSSVNTSKIILSFSFGTISLKKVSLNYRIYRERSQSLKATMISKLRRNDQAEFLPAIRAIDLQIKNGESISHRNAYKQVKKRLVK